jgi:hypothetical protein
VGALSPHQPPAAPMDVTVDSSAPAGDGDAGLGALLGRELFFASDSAVPSPPRRRPDFDDALLGGGVEDDDGALPFDGDDGDNVGVTADDGDDDRSWRDDQAPTSALPPPTGVGASSPSPPKRTAAGDATAALIEADLNSATAVLARRLRSAGGASWGGACLRPRGAEE